MLLMSFSQNILAQPGAGGTTGSGGTMNSSPGTTTLPGSSNNMNSTGNTSTDQLKINQSSTTSPTPTPTGGCINTAGQGQLCGTNATTYCNKNSSSGECSNFLNNGSSGKKTGTGQ